MQLLQIENSYRDVNIALANEIAAICENAGIDAWEAINLANLHPRVHLHQPGPGVGGHCISVDPWFIISEFRDEAKMIRLGREINECQPAKVVQFLNKLLKGIKKPVVTVMGITYKGNIDDIRESPALKIIDELERIGVQVKVYDPHVMQFAYETNNLKEAFRGSDCALVLADHDEFSFLYPKELATLMRTKQIYDTRNCIERNLWEENGFRCYLLGQGNEAL